MRIPRTFLLRAAPSTLLLVPLAALARGGGGEHYSGPSSDGGSDGGDGIDITLLFYVVQLVFRYPKLMIPLLGVGAVGYFLYKRTLHPTASTQRAFQQREAELRTQVSAADVRGSVNALTLKDPAFRLEPLLEQVRGLFLSLQKAWFERDMTPVRPFLSDATYQRFNVQLELLRRNGVRDAITDVQVLEVQLLAISSSEWFDTLHVRVRAQMRDTDAPAEASDSEALRLAQRAPLEPFTEVWSFVRKPGAKTKIGETLYQGKCPQCGAPFKGGASNACEYCDAIVNSGNYDWTLSEITQGVEHVRHHATVDGLLEARQGDPALNLEILEDRASLLFWKWVDAQSRGEAKGLAKVAHAEAVTALEDELERLRKQGRRKVFLECAVGGVLVRAFEVEASGFDRAHVEIRWSARMGIGPANEKPPALPTVPQRWIFTLTRKHGTRTPTEHGMSTSRCPQCHGPLTDSLSTTCDYCQAPLGSGERDWVLASAHPFEQWNAIEDQRYHARTVRRAVGASSLGEDRIADIQERQRLLYMMAAVAAADGAVGAPERKLLKLCSERWSVPWANVEMALGAGPQLFDRLIPKGSPEGEIFLRHIVEVALVDGRIDRQERRMLEVAAQHLDLRPQLEALLTGRGRVSGL